MDPRQRPLWRQGKNNRLLFLKALVRRAATHDITLGVKKLAVLTLPAESGADTLAVGLPPKASKCVPDAGANSEQSPGRSQAYCS